MNQMIGCTPDRIVLLTIISISAHASAAYGQDSIEGQFLSNVRQVTSGFVRAGEGYFAPDGQTIAFVTEGIENIPPGSRAKETYTILNSDEFTEIFELAAPDKDFQTYSESHFKRATSTA